MVAAIAAEIKMRKDYLSDRPLRSIYFGGGTPSLLDADDLELLFSTIQSCFEIEDDAEITLEANPDDISPLRLRHWRDTPINRLSIGVQSFAEADLRYMNRAHSALEAEQCIAMAQMAGFSNLTVDLIYGTPGMTDETWAANVQKLLTAGVPHISCYALTVEPKTALDYQVRRGISPPVEEEQAARQFELLMKWLEDAGYLHYEISNFALPDNLAVHNGNYWRGEPYLGVGPSAHSYNGSARQWNHANNAAYLKAVANLKEDSPGLDLVGTLYEEETLSPADQYNEYVMTGLRTIWGVDTARLEDRFKTHFLNNIHNYIDESLMFEKEGVYVLTKSGRLLADRISSEFFY